MPSSIALPNRQALTTVVAGGTVVPAIAVAGLSIEIFGTSPAAAASRGLVGAMLQDGGMMSGVLVTELLAMARGLYAEPLALDEAIDIAQLRGLERRGVDRLSGGQSQRHRLAMALIWMPYQILPARFRPSPGPFPRITSHTWAGMSPAALLRPPATRWSCLQGSPVPPCLRLRSHVACPCVPRDAALASS